MTLIFALTLMLETTHAQSTEQTKVWEYDPYRVRVWVAVDHSAMMPISYVDSICERINWSAEEIDLSGWRVAADEAPDDWRQPILDSIESLPFPEDNSEMERFLSGDKLTFVGVSFDGQQYNITAREIDCRTRLLGPIIKESTYQRSMVPHLAFRAVSAAFVPMVRIEQVNTQQGTAIARVRAGGFVEGNQFGGSQETPVSPVWVSNDDVFAPMVRKTDDSGSLLGGKVREIDWTFLSVSQRNGVVLTCDIHSAVRAPLGGRTSRLTEKLGLVVRPQQTETRLILESRDDPPIRIPGYEIHVGTPGVTGTDYLGKTDWDGSFVLDRRESSLQIVYVRSGRRALVRLPVVAGYHDEVTAAMFNDSIRRRAEGVMRGLESEFMIIVAQRELLSTRIRTALVNDELETAESLLRELRELPSLDQFQAKVNNRERGLVTSDRREQDRITDMFAQLRLLTTQNLRGDVVGPAQAEIEKYKAGEFGSVGDASNSDGGGGNSNASGFGQGN